MKLKTCVVLSASLVLALVHAAVCAQTDPYPSKPVRIIVGFTPGSATDVTARIIAQKFS
jgi:tripartite-type tricarboxylate transporter receptor subunit TctC